jgi:hypothetical protein
LSADKYCHRTFVTTLYSTVVSTTFSVSTQPASSYTTTQTLVLTATATATATATQTQTTIPPPVTVSKACWKTIDESRLQHHRWMMSCFPNFLNLANFSVTFTDHYHTASTDCDSHFCLSDYICDHAAHHSLGKYDYNDQCQYEHSTGFDLYSNHHHCVYCPGNHE